MTSRSLSVLPSMVGDIAGARDSSWKVMDAAALFQEMDLSGCGFSCSICPPREVVGVKHTALLALLYGSGDVSTVSAWSEMHCGQYCAFYPAPY